MAARAIRKPIPPGARYLFEGHDVIDLPAFHEDEKVLALFDDESLSEWSSEWPWFDDPDVLLWRAIKEAKRGNASELIRLSEAQLAAKRPKPKRGRGRPKGAKTSLSKRVATTPTHRAAGMVGLAEAILKDLYPEQTANQIYDRALLVVEYIWNDKKNVTVRKLAGYIKRGPKDRRHV